MNDSAKGFDKRGISVIIPSYKPQDYIFECLNSLKSQYFVNNLFEIIIILNGCDEPYYSYLKEYIENKLNNNNVALIQTNIGGVSNARNIGLDNARGKYVCFIDDDDFVSENYLKEMYNRVCDGVIVISNRYDYEDSLENAKEFYLFKRIKNPEFVRVLPYRRYLSSSCAKMIPVDMIGKKRFDIRFQNGEDALFMFSISNNLKYFVATNKDCIYYIRKRAKSLSHDVKLEYLIKNEIRFIYELTLIYINNIKGYSFILYLTRLLAMIKQLSLFLCLKINKLWKR